MYFVMDITFGFMVFVIVSFGGLGLCIAYVNHKRRDIHKAREDRQDQEHEAWVIGLHDDAELFTGSEVSNP